MGQERSRSYCTADWFFSSFSRVVAQLTKQSQSNDSSGQSLCWDFVSLIPCSLQILVEERERAFPGVVGSFLVVRWSRLVEEGVLCSFVDLQ